MPQNNQHDDCTSPSSVHEHAAMKDVLAEESSEEQYSDARDGFDVQNVSIDERIEQRISENLNLKELFRELLR